MRRVIRSQGGQALRAIGHLGGGVLIGAPLFVGLLLLGTLGIVLAPVLVGLPLLALFALSGLPVGAVERRRLRLLGPAPVPDPHRTPAEPGLTAWIRLRLTEQATWRELAYTVLLAGVLWLLDLLVLAVAVVLPGAMIGAPVQLSVSGGDTRIAKLWLIDTYGQAAACAAGGAVLLLVLLWPLTQYARARAAFTRLLLAPREAESERRLAEVTRSRARLVSAFDAERRRIERDLHDGAQQRLVALTMTLGLARLDAPPGPLAERLARAHEEAGQVSGELRELIHGIHPQVLADYGLSDALADAADRSAVPVDVDVELPRFAESVESAAYFAVREALANIGKHSGARRAWIRGSYTDGRLAIEVGDDGTGGADPLGSGLTGLTDRLAVLDGTLTVTSPAGGPTVLRLEIPCRTS